MGGCAGAQGGGGGKGFGETGAPAGKRGNEEGRVNRPHRQQPPVGCHSWAPSLPLPRVELNLHRQGPRGLCPSPRPAPPKASSSAHVQNDIAVLLEEVPVSRLGDRHHLQVLGRRVPREDSGEPLPATMTLWAGRSLVSETRTRSLSPVLLSGRAAHLNDPYVEVPVTLNVREAPPGVHPRSGGSERGNRVAPTPRSSGLQAGALPAHSSPKPRHHGPCLS